jgi:hypothetical protein
MGVHTYRIDGGAPPHPRPARSVKRMQHFKKQNYIIKHLLIDNIQIMAQHNQPGSVRGIPSLEASWEVY